MKVLDESKRIDDIDVYKAIGIILMLMGHIGFGKSFDYFIHAFHMPIFFVISGYLFKYKDSGKRNFKSYFTRKVRSLLVPYFVFGLFHYLFFCLTEGFSLQPLKCLFYINTGQIGSLPIAGALWFLTALFFTDVIFFIVDKYLPNICKIAILAPLSLYATFFGTLYPSLVLPFAIHSSIVGLGLYLMGYYLCKYEKKYFINAILNLSFVDVLIATIFFYFFVFNNGYVNMRTGSYANSFMFFVNVGIASCVILSLSRLIVVKLKDCFTTKWLIEIGRDSLIFLSFNQLFIRLLNYSSVRPLYNNSVVLKLLIIMLLLTVLARVINRTPLCVIIGKSYKKGEKGSIIDRFKSYLASFQY